MAVQYILSDIICAWRAVVLWNRDKRIVAIILLFILGTTGTYKWEPSSSSFCAHRVPTPAAAAACDIGINLVALFAQSHTCIQDEGDLNLGKLALIFAGPTLATNLLSTGLIAWKFW